MVTMINDKVSLIISFKFPHAQLIGNHYLRVGGKIKSVSGPVFPPSKGHSVGTGKREWVEDFSSTVSDTHPHPTKNSKSLLHRFESTEDLEPPRELPKGIKDLKASRG